MVAANARGLMPGQRNTRERESACATAWGLGPANTASQDMLKSVSAWAHCGHPVCRPGGSSGAPVKGRALGSLAPLKQQAVFLTSGAQQ